MASRKRTRATRPGQNAAAGRTKGKGSQRARQSRKRFLTWSLGVLGTAAAALIVSAVTGVFGAINHALDDNGPLLVSPARVDPAGSFQAAESIPGNASADTPNAQTATRYPEEFLLPGILPESSLPRVARLTDSMQPGDLNSWYLDMNISGTSTTPVYINGISVHVLHRMGPKRVTAIYSCWLDECTPTSGAPLLAGRAQQQDYQHMVAEVNLRGASVDLDFPASTIDVTLNRGLHFPFTVTDSAGETFQLTITAGQCTCDWVVNIDWSQGDRSGTKEIEENGRPFRVTGDLVVRRYCFDEGRPRGYANVADGSAVKRVCAA